MTCEQELCVKCDHTWKVSVGTVDARTIKVQFCGFRSTGLKLGLTVCTMCILTTLSVFHVQEEALDSSPMSVFSLTV